MKELLAESKNIFVVVYQGTGLNSEYVLIYNLVVPTNAHVIYHIYFTSSGCCMFWLVTILSELMTK